MKGEEVMFPSTPIWVTADSSPPPQPSRAGYWLDRAPYISWPELYYCYLATEWGRSNTVRWGEFTITNTRLCENLPGQTVSRVFFRRGAYHWPTVDAQHVSEWTFFLMWRHFMKRKPFLVCAIIFWEARSFLVCANIFWEAQTFLICTNIFCALLSWADSLSFKNTSIFHRDCQFIAIV